jgi:hypothetical protein
MMFGYSVSYQPQAPMGVGAKLFLTLFGLAFMGAGLLAGWAFVRDAAGGLPTRTWKKTACEITASNVGQQSQAGRQTGDFFFDVHYRYTFDGHQYSSEQYKRRPESSENYSPLARLAERYPAGCSAICFVNPSAPAQAVLVRYNLFQLFFFLFPIPFVAFGGWAIYYSWLRKSPSQSAAPPISGRAAPPQRRWQAVLFLLLFLVGSGAALHLVFLRPVFKMLSARVWPAVPCVVISSEVRSHSGNGTTYRVYVFYGYEFNGREFKSDTYDFMGGSSSGYEGKRAVVARYPPGTKAVCYVNPEEPAEAVLERGFTPDLLFGLIPLVFMFFGAFGLVAALSQRRKAATKKRTC